ncbi:chromosome partitioning protein [Desulfurispira natronophila]|uniref:Chromosome partitioning protein n=2 Tax=Desulfurispira natronophila TaxID=682562 RepID=A0A7W8DGD5_9BACT|nr:chromosome partitioning protein [Desulfurispira natronophila]
MFINLKGGVAKTTNAVAMAECMASAGYRTLLIDADHQCMAGELLLGARRQLEVEQRCSTLHDLLATLLNDEFHAEQLDAYITRQGSNIAGGLDNLSVLPCSVRIDDFQTNMAKARRGHKTNREFTRKWGCRKALVRRWLDDNFDFTIVDCPPSLAALQVKFFLAVCDAYIVPVIPDRLSVRGAMHLSDRVRKGGYKIRPLGTLWSLYRKQIEQHRITVERAAAGEGASRYLPRPFATIIPNSTRIAESTEPELNPKSFRNKYSHQFAVLYEALMAEIIERLEEPPC